MFALQRELLEEWVADQVRGLPPGPADRAGPATARQVAVLRPTVTRTRAVLIGAIALIVPSADCSPRSTPPSAPSPSPGSRNWCATSVPARSDWRGMIADRPRYINLVVLLRIACETTATVLLVALPGRVTLGLKWGSGRRRGDHGGRQLRRDRASGRAPSAGRTPIRSRWWPPFRCRRSRCCSRPISRLLVLIGNALTPGRGFRNGPFASEIELREVVDLAQQSGVVADDERRMIQSVFELGDTPAREVMVPRTEMVWIEADKTAGQATSLAVRSGHSRLPVIGENVDDVRRGGVPQGPGRSRRYYRPTAAATPRSPT